MPRFLVYFIAIPLVLLVGGFVLVSQLVDKDSIVELVARELKQKTGEWCAVDSKKIIADLAKNELQRKARQQLEEKYGEKAGTLLKGLLGDEA